MNKVILLLIIFTTISCTVNKQVKPAIPVWGVQFHPGMLFDNGSEMVQNHLVESPQDREFYQNKLVNKTQIDQNFLIFKNFIDSIRQ
ncbi:MAG: hypothetical protein U9P73_06495 [Candidatus Cloacimonadota bacterium]|nr:hypothetical protein [Candidatus Cloacimonadota bacterium]